MNKNDDKIKRTLENEDIPKELEPENIKKMLDEKVPAQKRKSIKFNRRFAEKVTAIASACAVIAGGSAIYYNSSKEKISQQAEITDSSTALEKIESPENNIQPLTKKGSYMNGAENYEQIYSMIKKTSENSSANRGFGIYGAFDNTMEIAEDADGSAEYESDDMAESIEEIADYSDTYNQEENVLEADIVKIDGKNIYYINNSYDDNYKNISEIHYASVDNGTFTNSGSINLNDSLSNYFGENYSTQVYVQDMYLYNDMLIVLGTLNGYDYSDETAWYNYNDTCFVTFYTVGENPELIDTYYQDGSYNDVRITPDGYMYLITDYSPVSYSYIENYEQIEKYIPSCGITDEIEFIPAENILLPADIEESYTMGYSVIGSIDLTQSGTFSTVETKALAGYSGDIYCSGQNLYTTLSGMETEITRISINSGTINPEASVTVNGSVKDQFSMSEYDGYFRIAVTNDEYEEIYHSYYDDETAWNRIVDTITGEDSGYYSYELTKRDNKLYVLDMDLNIVGSVEDFGIDETIKSVKFDKDIAYVVTYEQTDPLFAIDLSDPTNPTILDEFKILGYSTYMQEWDENTLLGFGVNADENGIETGIKLTMFDSSDPYNLNALSTYTIDRTNDQWLYSEAVYEHKALLIAPEKNIIGIPVIFENYAYYDVGTEITNTSKYMFFEYNNNEFIFKGEISYIEDSAWVSGFSRAVYIGDYVYALSADKFISADMETITQCDRIDF